MFREKDDQNHLKMEVASSDMKLREDNLEQAREDHSGRFIVHIALLLILLWILSRFILGL